MTKTISAIDAALNLLAQAGKLEATAGKAKAEALAQEGNAQAMAIAAMTTKGILSLTFDYDVKDSKGEVIEHIKGAKLIDYAHGFTKEGKEYRHKATAFRHMVLPRFFNIAGDNESVWAMFRQTFPAALALVGENMTASVADDKLVLEGGTGDTAKKLRAAAAKSVTALKTAAKGEAGKRKPTMAGEKGEASDSRPATLTDLLFAVREFLTQSLDPNGETEFAPTEADDFLIADIATLATKYVQADIAAM